MRAASRFGKRELFTQHLNPLRPSGHYMYHLVRRADKLAIFMYQLCRNSGKLNTLRTGLLYCLSARSRGLNFRYRASCI